MADKAISELIAAEQITATDMFVLEQNGTAKKLTGQVLLNWLTAAADGHGGIQSIVKTGSNGLEDTYRITLADTTVYDFVVTNGRGISSVVKTSTSGLVDTYTITYSDGTTSTFTVTNGAKGDQGENTYTWIKYASQEPTEASHSMGDVPDNWIGIYYGTSSSAPADWTEYQWFKMKGETGAVGDPATLVSSAVEYLVSDSGTVIPSGSWVTSMPSVAQGKYLWTRVTQNFNTGDPVIYYTVSRMGIDGLGSVQSVGGISPGSDGNVDLKPANIGALAIDGSNAMAATFNAGGYRVTNVGTPTADTDAVPKSLLNSYLNSVVTYYGATMSADDLLVPTALIPVSASANSELYNIVGGSFAYVITLFYSSVVTTSRRMQIGLSYNAVPAKMAVRVYGSSGWTAWKYPGFDENETYKSLYRNIDGVVHWLNPPMLLGSAYRTMERHNGKLVCKKIVSLGALPASTTKNVAHGIETTNTILSLEVYATSTTDGYVQQFPFFNTAGEIACKAYVSGAYVGLVSYSDLSSYAGIAVLRYIEA